MFSVQVWVLFSMMIILNQAVIINPERPPSKDIDSIYSKYITYPDAKRNIIKTDDSRYSLNIIKPKAKRSVDSNNIQISINITCTRSPSNEKKKCFENKGKRDQTRILVHIRKHGHKRKHKGTHKHKHKKGHKKLEEQKQPQGHEQPQEQKPPQAMTRPGMPSANGRRWRPLFRFPILGRLKDYIRNHRRKYVYHH